MFDRTYITSGRQTHEHRHTTTVHEHRAPTDASLQLLNEMRTQLQQECVAQGVVGTNLGEFKFALWKAFTVQPDCYELALAWNFNGKTCTIMQKHFLLLNANLDDWFVETVRTAVSAIVTEALTFTNLEQICATLKSGS